MLIVWRAAIKPTHCYVKLNAEPQAYGRRRQAMKYHVTLRVNLGKGTLYWVTDTEANSEEEAVVAAEHLFESQMEESNDWSFTDFDVENA